MAKESLTSETKKLLIVLIYALPFFIILAVVIWASVPPDYSESCKMPSSCTVGAGFGCVNATATKDSLTLTLKNNLGNSISFANIIFSEDPVNATCSPEPENDFTWTRNETEGTLIATYSGEEIPSGMPIGTFAFTNCKKMTSPVRARFSIHYIAAGETIPHSVEGRSTINLE